MNSSHYTPTVSNEHGPPQHLPANRDPIQPPPRRPSAGERDSGAEGVPELLSARTIGIKPGGVRREGDAEAVGRAQRGGEGLVVRGDGAERGVQPEGTGRKGFRVPRLQPVDGAAA